MEVSDHPVMETGKVQGHPALVAVGLELWEQAGLHGEDLEKAP